MEEFFFWCLLEFNKMKMALQSIPGTQDKSQLRQNPPQKIDMSPCL
jgi:hypothetical protein